MLTAAITSPHYFLFGSDPIQGIPQMLALGDLSSPRRLRESCDSAYRLFYCCLPLYDRVKVTTHLRMMLSGYAVDAADQSSAPIVSVHAGMRMLKHLADTGVAEFDSALDRITKGPADTALDAEHQAIRREFLTPEVMEAILDGLSSFETWNHDETVCQFLYRQTSQSLEEIARRITDGLRDGKQHYLEEFEWEASQCVEEVLDTLAGICGYAKRTGQDIYTFKPYMPLLLYAAVRDRQNYTGLRSFSLILPIIDTTESYSQAHGSFALLRNAIDHYQLTLTAGLEDDIAAAYVRVDEARHEAFKREFDSEARREIVTVTCLMTTIQGTALRHFLPDDHFHLSLSLEPRRYLSPQQTITFELLLDAVLLGIRELGADGSTSRTLLAACACQPLLDFVVLSQCQRLNLVETPGNPLMLGRRWGNIQAEIKKLHGTVGKHLEHFGRCVLRRRNILSHPAQHSEEVARTRGETLSDLCRLVDFIRMLDCSIPPTV